MHVRQKTLLSKIAAVLVTTVALVAPAHAAFVSITGGTASGVPASNDVLGPAGIGSGGGSIMLNGTLNITSAGVSLKLFDVGSESLWQDQIRLGNTSGPTLRDKDNFGAGAGGVHSPFQDFAPVTQNPGAAAISFYRTSPGPTTFLVSNGSSPHSLSSGLGSASIAFAYLSDANRIVSGATNRILVLLDDSGGLMDRDYDDYVGILVANGPTPVPLPAAVWLLGSGLLGLLGVARRRTRQAGAAIPATA